MPRPPAILAVDGGNSKTDAVLADAAGRVLGSARRIAPSNVGRSNGSLDVLAEAVGAAARAAGVDPARGPVARAGMFCLAGADTPSDERTIARALGRRGWTREVDVRNDTAAVLRAGTDRGWGVGLVCGAGMNCIGVGPTGNTARFAALGELSGDLAAGGEWIGRAALAAAVRAQDGRGSRTALEVAVPRHFGLARPEAVARAMYRERIPSDRLVELPPTVFRAAAKGDRVAREILDRLADEVAAMATAAIRRVRLTATDVDVILGGGVFRAGDTAFLGRIRAGIAEVAPEANVRTLDVPPLVGALLLALDAAGASAGAHTRARRSFAAANGTAPKEA
ncbi:MAG TPA: BadF/BadG/BcrA/BcrD ATPase family protein [Actinomycetota bacterium]|nr:BadF/BadG/BcrA/BcrD ATPase family protein [Actinomycetota bacterium]